MAQQAAARFLDRIERDAELKARVAALGDNPAIAGILELASAAGFSFTADELTTAARVRIGSSPADGGELSDEALEKVSGGAFNAYLTFHTDTTSSGGGGGGGGSSKGGGSSGQW
jgi:predicted ribosomally synthesized peptide with nif11-like leader